MLEAGRRLDRRNDLAGDAELGEARNEVSLSARVTHRLVEADQPFLVEVVGLAAGEYELAFSRTKPV